MQPIRKTLLDSRFEIETMAAKKAIQLRCAGLSIVQVSRALRTNPIQVAHWVGEINLLGEQL